MAKFAHDQIVPYDNSQLSKKEQVANMFNHIAGRYDFLNRLLSAGIDKSWRRKAIAELASLQPQKVLDVATGTADVALLTMEKLAPAQIIGIDISEGMLALGREKIKVRGWEDKIQLVTGDSAQLPYPDHYFDAITVAFGVRNFQDLEKGLREMYRVLRPGGKLVVLEFSQPHAPVMKQAYQLYMNQVTPNIGKIFSQNKAAYQYLNESVQAFPEGDKFLNILHEASFTQSYLKRLAFGICTIYCAGK